jgi:flagellar hook protein FlgE
MQISMQAGLTAMKTFSKQIETSTKNLAEGLPDADIAEEFVNQITAEHGFKANAKTIKTYDETIGSLIDIMG